MTKEDIVKIRVISYKTACDFLLPRHYSGRKPVISIAFGLYVNRCLKAVCSFGKPASNFLCRSIMNGEYITNVYELNRLCREDDLSYQLSEFVAACLRYLAAKDWIIVSYADTQMNHAGYIYQALNFLYTGATKRKIDRFIEDKHPRHIDSDPQNIKRQVRSVKHRYVYFATNNKKLKKEWTRKLVYPVLPYPKTENRNYVLGEYLKPEIITA